MNQLPKAGPWATRQEFLVDQALDNALSATSAELRRLRPVARPQVLFPERVGFASDQWTIEEVLNIDRRTPTYRSWVSGMPVMRKIDVNPDTIQAGTRNSMTEQFR